MPIDPSIPLNIPGIQLQNPLEVMSALEQMKGQREQAELRRLAAEEARERRADTQEQRARQRELEERYAKAVRIDPETGTVSLDGALLLRDAPAHLVPTLLKAKEDEETRMSAVLQRHLAFETQRRTFLSGEGAEIEAELGNPEAWSLRLRRMKDIRAIDQATYDRLLKVTDAPNILAIAQAWQRAGTKPGESFTLGEGQIRYGPGGQEIARGPAKAPPPIAGFTLAPGAVRYGPDGKIIAESPVAPPVPGGFTLSPGATRFGPGGEVVASVPATDAGPAKMSAATQAEIATMLTAEEMAADVLTLGKETGWAGVGPWEGRVGATPLGSGGKKGETLRNNLGNIQATIALMRGGTSFTDTEKALLETYTPTTTDSDSKIETKLNNLVSFIQKKRANVLRVAGGDYNLPTTTTPTPARAPTTKANPFTVKK